MQPDRPAFEAYVRARYDALVRTGFLLTGSRQDAEDLVQTALAKTWLSWDRIESPGAIDGYVRKVLVNTQTSVWRRKAVKQIPMEHLPEDPSQDPNEALVLHDALWRALQKLPKKQRAAVVLRYYEDLTEAQTAEVLGVSVGTVKSATSRALSTLRDERLELLGAQS